MLLDGLSKDVEPIVLVHFETLQSLIDSEKGTEAALQFYAYTTLVSIRTNAIMQYVHVHFRRSNFSTEHKQI